MNIIFVSFTTILLLIAVVVAAALLSSVDAFVFVSPQAQLHYQQISTRRSQHIIVRASTNLYSTKSSSPSSSSSSSIQILSSASNPLAKERYPPKVKSSGDDQVEVLSNDPLIYVVRNLLSQEECEEFINRSEKLTMSGNREMKQSNPPEVSLDTSKLWPLPLLSIGFGIPPLIHNIQDYGGIFSGTNSLEQVAWDVLPSIVGSFVASLGIAYGIIVPLIRKFSDTSSRTSIAMAFNIEEDIPYITNFVTRVCHITDHNWKCWEAPVITKYNTGAIFAKHSDASPTRGSEWKNLGGQRVVTCICYLNNCNEGGETYFNNLKNNDNNIRVKPTQGTGLFFYPCVPGDSLIADDDVIHESLPVLGETNEKYIIQMFGRVGPRVPPPLGIPDEFE